MEKKYTNLLYLIESSGNNKEFLKEMINIFLNQTPDLIEELKDFRIKEDWVEFRKIMHKIKPTFIMIGIDALNEVVIKIDKAAKQGIDLELLPDLLNEMETVCNKAYIELKKEIELL